MADESDENELEMSPEQEAIVLEFQDITGLEDFDECKQLLSQHSWDLQIAVQDALNRAEGRNDVYKQETQVDQQEGSDSDEGLGSSDGSSVLATPLQMPWSTWLLSVATFPFQFGYSVVFDVYRFVVNLVWHSLFAADTTPLEDVLSFKESFENKYGDCHPTLYQGSYSQAIEDAKKELRFLLVYLHAEEHRDTEQFCRSTLTNSGFKEYVNGNMLFWAADVRSREGYRVSCALRETTYPFLAVICLRENRMMVVGRLQGLMTVDGCLAGLTQILNDNEASLVAARNDRQERSFNQSLREEQDAAYLESLKADQEKERRKSLEAETKRLQEERKKDKEQSIQNRIKAIAERREELSRSLPAEPDGADPDAIRIVIRLPHGERMDRFFLKTDQLQSLYDYVFCNEQCPHDFKLVSQFPRKVFETSTNADVTLAEVGLATSATLFVHDLTEGSDDDEEEDD